MHLTKHDLLEKGMATHSSFLPQEPYERQKKMTQEDESSRLVGIQFATREEQRNSPRKNEEAKTN